MKLKMNEVVALYYEINGIKRGDISIKGILLQELSMKTKFYIQRLNKVVGEEFNLYTESEKELFKKYGTEQDGQISIEPEKQEDFFKEQAELLSVEKDIDVDTLWGTGITVNDLDFKTEDFYPVFLKLIDK